MKGAVTGASGAPIPSAHITETSCSIDTVREIITGHCGLFKFNALDPSNCSIRIESDGARASVSADTVSPSGVIRGKLALSVQRRNLSAGPHSSPAVTYVSF